MLFRLGTFRAVVRDVPMDARYGDEVSNLRIGRVLGEFLGKHVRNFAKRVFYNYFLRDMSIASLELVVGSLLTLFGLVYGGWHWWLAQSSGQPTATGVIMLAAMPVLVGLQLLLAFMSYDIASVPRHALGRMRPDRCVRRDPQRRLTDMVPIPLGWYRDGLALELRIRAGRGCAQRKAMAIATSAQIRTPARPLGAGGAAPTATGGNAPAQPQRADRGTRA